MDQSKAYKDFVKTDNGLKVVVPEGYVILIEQVLLR